VVSLPIVEIALIAVALLCPTVGMYLNVRSMRKDTHGDIAANATWKEGISRDIRENSAEVARVCVSLETVLTRMDSQALEIRGLDRAITEIRGDLKLQENNLRTAFKRIDENRDVRKG